MAVRKPQVKVLIQPYGKGPTKLYGGLDTLELAVYDAVANYKEGHMCLCGVCV